MILGFRDQFVPFVLDGSKTHTIRAGKRWTVGMRADLYARPRQKSMRLLFRARVAKIQTIEIAFDQRVCQLSVLIDGESLFSDEIEAFFFRDGFRGLGATAAALSYWRGQLPFSGQLIHWDYAARFEHI